MTSPVEPPPIESGPDDAAVIARVLCGEIQCFSQIVERYQAPLYRHAVSIVLDHDVAADMAQDAFVRAYMNLGTCRDHTRFRAWLFQTLRNRCFDYLKEARRKNVPIETAAPMADGAEGPYARVERRRLREELRVALMALPDAQREAFLMHHIEGVPYEAMAELLDASVSALKMRVLRARESLGARLRDREVTQTLPVRLSARGG
jgi:RNA polymerase sigma-70 factor (ECF subfamily)